MTTEKESEVVAIMYRYLEQRYEKVRLEVHNFDIVAYSPRTGIDIFEAKLKDWKKVFYQANFGLIFANHSYVVMPSKYIHLAIRNWDKAPVGIGLYEVGLKTEEVKLVYPSVINMRRPDKSLRRYEIPLLFSLFLGRPF